jgi:cation:H+ antiporter
MSLLLYFSIAFIVVWFSKKCANYVDLVDKKTSISGAFIGGVILAAVTSLPELFTTISSIVFINNPEFVIGNILGSNLFNAAILALLIVCFANGFSNAKIASSHLTTTLAVASSYLIVSITVSFGFEAPVLIMSTTSLILFIIYIASIKKMAIGEPNQKTEKKEKQELKAIIIKFILCSIGLVASSIAITFVTDLLATEYKLGSTLAGAMFLGVATSLPEVSSTFALIKKCNFNAAIGNIMGSNMFNFVIFAIGDVFYNAGSIYSTTIETAQQTENLIFFGIAATVCMGFIMLLKKYTNLKKLVYIILSLITILSYLAFLGFSI